MTIKENEKLISDFPFLRETWNGNEYIYPDGKNETTWFDDVPIGWEKIFLDMCAEIKVEYDKMTEEQKEKFRIEEIKEKYGSLRVYVASYTDKISEIIDKYEEISRKICIGCGKPAEYMTTGWICPYCADCIKDLRVTDYISIEETENGL